MLSITVSSQAIVTLVLLEIIQKIETKSGLDELLRNGCDAASIDLLRRRPARDLSDIAPFLARSLLFAIDMDEVRTCLLRLDSMRRTQQQLEYFVKHGASRQMVNQLFSVSQSDVRAMQEMLIGPSRGPGRTSLPKTSERDEIHQDWHRISLAHTGLREQLYHLHMEHPDYTIEALWQTVNEFNADQEVA
ncbi:DUF2857 family protein [Corticibacter populi]|uniref:DUF2857 family protein n=1 Tax=Corticibacter populi TaxID=1550736 RepID=A0A3M6QYY0_9BURK|nr:STY4526/YPO1902 family pathogenicity island replication protein [Corticibacter populi]RMX08230.1 DUF2857 family protein [Corticibacter populi]RZS35504.1 uncharacterized protein DUF2857 [Corticibacter populi]